jgi:hypothetical protein
MTAHDYVIDFTGLCLVHVTPAEKGGRQAIAYSLRGGAHCAKLLFPFAAWADKSIPDALAPAEVVHVPDSSLYVSIDINGYELWFEGLAVNDVKGAPSGNPCWPVTDWCDLDNSLDLKYMSGQTKLDLARLRAKASAVFRLPDGTLSAVKPADKDMAVQPWKVHTTKTSRKQGLSDRIRHTFKNSSGGVVLKLTEIDGCETVKLNFDAPDGGVHFVVSSLCTLTRRVTGMPDVPAYGAVVPPSVIQEPSEADAGETSNGSGCPPTLFVEP